MKTTAVFRWSAALFLLSCSTLASAQSRPTVSVRDGYWNLISNLSCPTQATVRFYNGQHQLLHEKQVAGKRFVMKRNLIRPRTMSELNATLYQVLRETQPATDATVSAQ
ncbi:hypothetical protein [Hymenobacter sp. YC55]|uniref:hypothetical protein n=1 Tax=Hymenobacter sp. YC55 TaxID=3034019 RepID=UPI0023F92A43|nr:hypothetical protein [Hymenobacter sp. YC55]MDF7810645.1 hypothetical protein [Hymenobacter sp. YC55]